ncbi:formyl transferase [Bisporella sp. PMI_857]|nr:formyl transferase [Bisporella sp. PMI_857]
MYIIHPFRCLARGTIIRTFRINNARFIHTDPKKEHSSAISDQALAKLKDCQGAAPDLVKFPSEKLRILFCGSDDFSCAALRALHEEQQRDHSNVDSIEVFLRPGKPTGRGLKQIRDVPLKAVAQELGLKIYERDTFTGWEMPLHVNLIVAVSFGLFVPPRILKSALYRGINIHPSLLPKFRGPAPLQHTIMSGSTVTGVTLQTLDEKTFDHGKILAQTPQHETKIPDPFKITYSELLKHITPKATDLLIKGIRERLYLPSTPELNFQKPNDENLIHATKITSADRQIEWRDSILKIERYNRAIGRLWSDVHVDAQTVKRLILEDMEIVDEPETLRGWHNHWKFNSGGRITQECLAEHPDVRFMVLADPSRQIGDLDPKNVAFYVKDGSAVMFWGGRKNKCIRVREITVSGKGKAAAATVMDGIKDREVWQLKKHRSHRAL